MSKFKVGDRVRIRSWESMEKEFGLAETGSVDCARRFVTEMKHLCGREATISDICEKYVTLSNWSDGAGDTCWEYSTDMLELALHSSIHVTTDGKTTHAVLKEGGKVSKRAKAICSPHDEFDFETGARIAFDRLCTSLAENSAFKGVREVKRPAKVGDWVKFIKDHGGKLTPGSIHRVEFERDGTLFFPCNCICSDRFNDKYVILEGYTPEPEKPQYYNGKIVCVDLNGLNLDSYTVGKVYAIVDGVLTNDKGIKIRQHGPVESFDEWCKFSGSKFIEYKGEA